ncbi:hypothetical protein Leryth_012843 [Lithospermum erythrorhizon]|nr:hypothetical protein Leryth_012843 [Lithospermum erythrorhizon]
MLLALYSWEHGLHLIFLREKEASSNIYIFDYSITNFLTVSFGFSLPYLAKLISGNWPCVLIAMIGGIFLSVGNLSMQYALAIVGLSVTEVITSSIAVVLGTTLNYFLDDRINKAEILFPGVGCFLIAVCLGSAVHTSNAKDIAAKLTDLSDYYNGGEKEIEKSNSRKRFVESRIWNMEVTKGTNQSSVLQIILCILRMRELIFHILRVMTSVLGKSVLLGIGITFFGGGCYALFSPTFNLATNDQWHLMRKGVPRLVVYTAFFYFSLSFVLIALLLNIIFLYHPVLNLPKSSFKAYLSDWKGREWAFLAGMVCGRKWAKQFMRTSCRYVLQADCVQCEYVLMASSGHRSS